MGMCGTTVHSRRCGWRGWQFNQIAEQKPAGEELADVFPDETTGFDSLGPFEEMPSEEQEANQTPAKIGWENDTALQAAAFNTWGQSFCTVHRVGTLSDSSDLSPCNSHGSKQVVQRYLFARTIGHCEH